MQLKSLLILSLASVLTFGCTQKTLQNQPAESPVAESASVITASSQENPSTKLAQSVEITTIKSGTFASGEHPTQGTASIVTKNGKTYLEFDGAFKTSEMGPDLVVILHRSDNVLGSTKPPAYPLKEGDYVFLAELKKFSGAQSYPIPDNVNLEDYKSAVVWCRKFNATFGAAKFSS